MVKTDVHLACLGSDSPALRVDFRLTTACCLLCAPSPISYFLTSSTRLHRSALVIARPGRAIHSRRGPRDLDHPDTPGDDERGPWVRVRHSTGVGIGIEHTNQPQTRPSPSRLKTLLQAASRRSLDLATPQSPRLPRRNSFESRSTFLTERPQRCSPGALRRVVRIPG